ncbi:hypothetical protein VNI00_000192 [Paramarasmius palmivorus]|uniref:Uncharacterized protein n=1 Tax=Paramarasmius palmivorus TaxID=297713 RepID=A0AAW0EEB5_9AGAR
MPPVVASRGSGVRPIRSDPAYYAQASGYSSYGQSGHHLPFPGRSNPSRDTGLYGSSGPMLPPPDPYSRQVYEPSSSGHYGNYLPPPVLPPLDPFRRESLSSQHHQPAGSLPTPFLGQRFDENSESRLIGRKRGGTDEDGSSVSEGLEADSFGIEPGGTTSGTMSRTATPSGASSTEAGTSQSKVPKKTLIACDFCRGTTPPSEYDLHPQEI